MITRKIKLDKDAKLVINKILELKSEKKIRNISDLNHIEGRKEFKKIRNYFKKKEIEKVTWVYDTKIKNFKVRHYRGRKNSTDEILPVMIFFHGGGWVLGDLETHDSVCRSLVTESKFDLIAVDYSLAPEFRFPKAVEDSIDTLKWISEEHEKLKVDPEKIIVCGDSAGGNLASVLSIYNRDILKKNIFYQILIYPATTFSTYFPSKEKYEGIILSKELMEWFEKKYLPEENKKKFINDWRLSPTKSKNLKNLPPTLLILAECDPLYDEGNYFAELLKKNHNNVEVKIYKGQIHGFLTMGGYIRDTNLMIEMIKNRINSILN